MEKKILTSRTLSAVGPYSLAVEAGGFIFISGQIPLNPDTGEMVADISGATRQVLKNLKSLLEENGLTLENVLKTTIFLKSISDFAEVNEIYAGFFSSNPPARSTMEAPALPRGALLEIEAVAAR